MRRTRSKRRRQTSPTSSARPDGPRHAGRRALVTGASSGIGRATALRLGADGAAVGVNHVPGAERDASAVVGEIAGAAAAVVGDVSREDDVARMFERAEEELGGPVDLLVNNAGVESSHLLEEMSLEAWEHVIGVNLTGPFLCSREFARRLPQGQGGTIVNVSSVHERIPWRSFSHYCASKGGLKLFAETIANELGPRGIRVVGVAPGATLTPINREQAQDPAWREEQERQTALRRLGEPEEMAAAISWLASEEAGYITGDTLFVDGGMQAYPDFL